jgi:predicted ATP-binding protein involved in virulence
MRLQQVRITNCFGFTDTTIDLAPNLVYILGRNSSGKTAILTAISNLSPAKNPAKDPRAENFTPTKDTPFFQARFTVSKTPREHATSFLDRRLKERNIPSQARKDHGPLKNLHTLVTETYAALMSEIGTTGTLYLARDLDGDYYLSTTEDRGPASQRIKTMKDAIGRLLNANDRFTFSSTEYAFPLTAYEIENAAASIITPIYHFSEQYQLTADLPDHVTTSTIDQPPNPAAQALIEYLGKDDLRERLTTNDPDRQEALLTQVRARAQTLSDQISATAHKLVEFTLSATSGGIQLTVRTDGKKSFYRHISDATKFLIAYHLYNQVHKPGAVLLFDEPTRGLHASVERDVRAFLNQLATSNHVVVSTHSEHLIDLDKLEGIRLMQQDEHHQPIVLNRLRPPRDRQGFALALQPVFDAIGLAYSNHVLTKDKVILTEGLTDYLYVRAIHEMAGTDHAYGIAPGRGESSLFTIIPFFISQGVSTKIILDHPQLMAKLQESFGIPEDAFYLIPTTHAIRGIEDLFTTADFQRILSEAGITVIAADLEHGNSTFAKTIDKRLVAQHFLTSTQTLEVFEEETRKNMDALLAFCTNKHWFAAL